MILTGLGRFVTQSASSRRVALVVGLDVAGAFGSASLAKLVDSLVSYDIPAPICGVIGTWLTGSMFKIKLRSPIETVYSRDHVPTRGVPQGGAPSPLLWLLHVNRIVEDAMQQLHRDVKLHPVSWNVIIQIFAGDISAAVGRGLKPVAIDLAHTLISALLRQLRRTDLEVSIPKCKNFLPEGVIRGTHETRKDTMRNMRRNSKQLTRQRVSHDLGALEASGGGMAEKELPFPWVHSFELLGVTLDCGCRFSSTRRRLSVCK